MQMSSGKSTASSLGLIWQRIRVVCASFESGDIDVSSSFANTHVGYILIVLAIIQT